MKRKFELKRKAFVSVSHVLILVVVLFYNNCGQNPIFVGKSSEGGSGIGNPMHSKAILDAICRVVSRCQPQIEIENCRAGVLATTGFGPQFGLPSGSYSTFASILQGEQLGRIESDPASLETCSTTIDNLRCSDPLVQSAYDASLAQPYSGTTFMIPIGSGSCSTVFSEPPGMLDYYVSTTGNDNNDGSKDRPWATINKAAIALTPGSEGATVHVAPGVYTPVAGACSGASGSCGVHTARSGTSVARIAFVSDQPGGAKIQSSGAYSSWYNSGDYVDIIGFEIAGDGSTNIGVQNDASNVRVMGNHIHDIPVAPGCPTGDAGGGIRHSNPSSSNNSSIGNLIHDIGPLAASGLPAGSYCNHAHGISHGQPGGSIVNNRIYRVSTYAISTWLNASDLEIGQNLIYSSGAIDSSGGAIGGGILVGAGEARADAINNNTRVFNNILRNNGGRAIFEFGATGTGNSYLNNLLYSNNVSFVLKNGLTAQGTINADPLMINFQLNGSGDYRLQSSSPAIDAGDSSRAPALDAGGFMRPYGRGADIGPYEWHP